MINPEWIIPFHGGREQSALSTRLRGIITYKCLRCSYSVTVVPRTYYLDAYRDETTESLIKHKRTRTDGIEHGRRSQFDTYAAAAVIRCEINSIIFKA